MGGVGDDRGSMDNGGGVDSVGNNGGVVDNRVGNSDGGSGNVATSRGRGVDGLTGVGDLSDVSGQVVGVVGDGLDPAVGKVDGVRSSHGTSAIVGLSLLEVGLGEVISNGIAVGVGGGLGEVGSSNGVHNWVSNSMGNGVGDRVDKGGSGVEQLGGRGGRGDKGKGDEGLGGSLSVKVQEKGESCKFKSLQLDLIVSVEEIHRQVV